MSDNDNNGVTPEPNNSDGGQDADQKNHDPEHSVTIPEGKLKGFEARVARAESENKDLKSKLQAIEEAEQKKRGDYESLLTTKETELHSTKAELEEKESKITEAYATLERYYNEELEKIPEDKRDLIPDTLPLTDKLEQARRLVKAFSLNNQSQNSMPKNSANNPLEESSELEKRVEKLKEIQRNNGLSEKEQEELIEKSRQLMKLKRDK
jgi:hypothetical protein